MVLPNFLIVGAQKCGTTSLYEILDNHPEVSMSITKEVNFFINQNKYKKGLKYYSSFFKKKSAKAIGEVSPGYICYPDIHKKIYQDLGQIKIIIILRNPVRRAYSQYWDNRRQLKEALTENEIINHYLEVEYNPERKGYFSRGVYYEDVKKYLDLFGRENVKVIIFEKLLKNQTEYLRDLYKFLGLNYKLGYQKIPKAYNNAVIWKNIFYTYFLKHPDKTKYVPSKLRKLFFFGDSEKYTYKMPTGTNLKRLKEFYASYNYKLENLLNIELKEWRL